MVIMASFWVTEALPIAITSLIPVALLPALGVMSTTDVGKEYIKETSLMFLSSIMVAIAVEHSNLHRRIALKVMTVIGTGPRRLMLGFMLPTMFLSMWMSNVAITAMMIPIVDAVLTELDKELLLQNTSSKQQSKRSPNLRVMFFLSVAYAANTGGPGTLTGTGSNLVLKGILSQMSDDTPVNFATWMLYSVPMVLINTFVCWLWLQCWFLGFGNTVRAARNLCKKRKEEEGEDVVMRMLHREYSELGAVTFHEGSVLFLFVTLILLWIFRDPKFVRGWGTFVTVETFEYKLEDSDCNTNCTYVRQSKTKEAIDDATAGMFVVLLLFAIPANPKFWPFSRSGEPSVPSPSLLTWSAVHSRTPWVILLLFGAGFSLAKAFSVSGLSALLGSQLVSLQHLDKGVLVVVIVMFTAAATEVTSNAAVCSILLPVVRDLAFSLEINPLFLMLPTTLACSYAFMLPVANPSNAVVYATSGMKTSDMFKCGFFLNFFCVGVNIGCLYLYGIWLFGMDEFPQWAKDAKLATVKQ